MAGESGTDQGGGLIMDLLHIGLGAVSGVLVGFTLGLVGGGGSILAVPLMVYLVGVKNPHIAIGTSAFAVAANAAIGLLNHAKAGNVKWRCGGLYAAAGIAGALLGSSAGKAFSGQKLLFLFALIMVLVGVLMLRGRKNAGIPGAACNRENAPKVLGFGIGTGLFSGFFGIGGGFLIVPGLVAATRMPILNAVGTSLVAVTAFGLTTAAKLWAVRPGRLESGAGVYHRRDHRQHVRHPDRETSCQRHRPVDHGFCRADLRSGLLYDFP